MNRSLKRKDIDLFFKTLSKEWPYSAEILLVGASVALIIGGERPTLDIDFEVSVTSKTPKKLKNFAEKVREIAAKLEIEVQFSEDVDSWSQISFLDYNKHGRPYKKYGKIAVNILEPSYWSIGKVTRYWQRDIKDMELVFSKEKPDPVQLAKLWLRALRKSPASTALFGVKKQMSHFFKTSGPKIWKKALLLDKILALFEE